MKRCIVAVGTFLIGASTTACSVRHIKDYEVKRREYQPIVKVGEESGERPDGAIWAKNSEGATFFTDARAFRVNDVVTVRIEEVASARRDAATNVGRDGSFNVGGDAFGLVEDAAARPINPDRLVHAGVATDFDYGGRTSRSDAVRFTVAATVTQVLPNGNLFVEGQRVVLVNSEEHHFYISGVARPEDIRRDNSISSIQLADAQVEFAGDGVLSEGQDPGWFTRLLNWLSPL